MVSDNHNNESFNLIKYIILILISISIGLLIATLHNREIIFASSQGYSFGILDVDGDNIQSDNYEGPLLDAFYYHLYTAYTNLCTIKGWTPQERSLFYGQLDLCLDASSNNYFDSMFELGYLPNVCYANGALYNSNLFYIVWQKTVPTIGITWTSPSINVPVIKANNYPAIVGNLYLDQTYYLSELDSENTSGQTYYNISQFDSSSLNSPVVISVIGNLNSSGLRTDNFNNFLHKRYYTIDLLSKWILSVNHYSNENRADPIWQDITICLLSSYPFYDLWVNDTIAGSYRNVENNLLPFNPRSKLTFPTYSDDNRYTVGWSPRTQFFFNQYVVTPLFPTPTPIPPILPTITPTPLPLAYDSNIDGFGDGSTLGFLGTLKSNFEALVTTYNFIPFFTISISYLFHYSVWFRILIFVPLIAFLSFLLGRNKS